MNLKIEGVSYRPSMPITVVRTLDESLDSASAVIPYTDRSDPFTPFSYAELDGERWLVGADIPAEVKGLRGKWRHDVTLIEETKRLETLFISGKVITKHEYRDYMADAKAPAYELVSTYDPYHSGYDESSINPSSLGIPAIIGTHFTLNSAEEVRGRGAYTEKELSQVSYAIQKLASKPHVAWVESGGNVLSYTNSIAEKIVVDVPKDIVKNTLEAHYMLLQESALNGNPVYFYEIKYNLQPMIPADRTTNKTALEVVEELIADAEQLRYKDKPRIKLSEADAAKLDKIEAPEDAFAQGMTLFEALLKVGDWEGVNGIPKLQRDVLTFEGRGGTEIAKIRGRMIADTSASTAEDYCSVLESNAANMIDEIGRGVTDPFTGGYRTVRTEEGAAFIEDGTLSIHTSFPIWQVTELTLGHVGGKINADGGDLTQYVYEKTEYDLLSDYTDAGFPMSKAYAVYYTKGSPNINGLSFVPNDLTGEIFESAKYNAIERILNVKFGRKTGLKSEDFVNLPFRVTYIPYISTRIRQHKMNTNGIEAGMAYGQGGNVISARTYGNHLRARAQMLGLPERTQQYVCGLADEIPTPGQRINDTDYIGTVSVDHYKTYRKVQITSSPYYNRLNRFIDVKKDLRQYDIPMDGSTERNIISEDYVVLGKMEGKFDSMMTNTMREATISAILGNSTVTNVMAAVLSTSNVADKTDGVQVILPVVKAPVGTSVLFYAKYKDNYSAGTVSESTPRFGTTRRLQRDIRYTDIYGNAKYLHVDLVAGALMNTENTEINAAHSMPLTEGVTTGRSIVSTGGKPILLNKDARESISFTYQVHYVSNTDLIIGSELAARSPWITQEARTEPMVYFYSTPINPVTGEATEPETKGYAITRGKLLGVDFLQMPTKAPNHKAWAVKQDGAFLFGANSKIPEQIFINFRDRLRVREGAEDDELREMVFLNFNVVNATHIHVADFIDKGETLYDNFKANSGHALPDTITVKKGGMQLSASQYTWQKLGSKTAILEIPNVDDTVDVTVIAHRSSYNVVIEYELWDEFGNDLLYTEYIRGIYPYGFRFDFPEELEREHHGEMQKFTLVSPVKTIIVDRDIRTFVTYNMNSAPPLYVVEEEYELWDQYGNDLLLVQKYQTLRHEGFEFPVLAEREAEYEGEMRVFQSGKGKYYVKIEGNTKISEQYYLKAAAAMYTVNITLEYWDEHQNDYRFNETIAGMYQAGHVITIPGVVVRNEKTYRLNGDGKDVEIVVNYNFTETYIYTEMPSSQYDVSIAFTFWDKYGNDLLFTEDHSATYVYGSKITIPGTLYRVIDEESREFKNTKGSYIVTVTGDRTISEDYYLTEYDTPTPDPDEPDEPDEPDIPTPDPLKYTVNITLEYWDEFQNDHRFDEYITGTYEAGSVITIPGTAERNDRAYLINGGNDIRITVNSSITETYIYTEVPTEKYDVTVKFIFWDKDGNSELDTEEYTAEYVSGSVISIPGTLYRTIGEEQREFASGKGTYTVTVDRNMTISEDYYLVEPTKYYVDITLDYWDEFQNDLWFTETISGEYLEGSSIVIPASVKREYNGEIRAFLLVESSTDVVIKVDGDIRRFYTYQEKT